MARPDVGTLPETVTTDPSQPGGRPDTVEASTGAPDLDREALGPEELSGEAIRREAQGAEEVASPGAVSASSSSTEISEAILNGDLSPERAAEITEALPDGQRREVEAELRAVAGETVQLTPQAQSMLSIEASLDQYRSQMPDAGANDPLASRVDRALRDIEEQFPEAAESVDRVQRQDRAEAYFQERGDALDPTVDPDSPTRDRELDPNPARPDRDTRSPEDLMTHQLQYQGYGLQQI